MLMLKQVVHAVTTMLQMLKHTDVKWRVSCVQALCNQAVQTALYDVTHTHTHTARFHNIHSSKSYLTIHLRIWLADKVNNKTKCDMIRETKALHWTEQWTLQWHTSLQPTWHSHTAHHDWCLINFVKTHIYAI